ncbi:MAG TPA: SDR family NAD(P)-dependent oxidoreductase, partial [Thermoanaerobaculia bacterium]|nr:SDR family NAD(P)-dependent oxidoreductase [Thermoanaerobaculia bacterium]
MNRELREIYIALSNGELSRQQALEKIKAAKLHHRREGSGSLLAAPVWQAADSDTVPAEFAERHVLLCGLTAVDEAALTAGARCATVDLDSSKNPAERYVQATLACFERIRGILQSRPEGNVLVQIVAPAEGEGSLFAGLTALLRTAALENPHCSGQVILVPESTTSETLSAWLDAEAKHANEPLVRYDGDARQVLRWKEVGEIPDRPPLAFRDDGVYLITGGLGALGFLFAKEILDRTIHARVILTGRAELNAEAEARLGGLTTQPGRVYYRRLDLGNAEDVRELIAGIHERYGQLDGILHCAGMIADNFILRKSADELTRVLIPKVLGTYNLDQAASEIELEFFALFSSYAGAMGNVGQADYAAANAFMDRFASLRNHLVAAGRRHGRTRSIDWPLWEAGGMAIDPTSREVLERATGMRPMQTATGIAAFHYALSLPQDQVLVGEGDLARMRSALLRGPAAPQAAAPPVPASSAASSISPERLLEKTVEYLRHELSGVLKLPAPAIDPQAALEEYGIDSILAMKLTSRLEQTFGTLSKTLFFEYQTIAALAEYFAHSHAGQLAAMFTEPLNGEQAIRKAETPVRTAPASSRRAPGRLTRAQATAPRPIAESEPIAIIGLSGRYPEAFDIEAYWKNLREGKDCIVEIPKDRWDWHEYFSEDRAREGHHYSKWGGFIEGVDEFDPLFFNISPKEARLTDP